MGKGYSVVRSAFLSTENDDAMQLSHFLYLIKTILPVALLSIHGACWIVGPASRVRPR